MVENKNRIGKESVIRSAFVLHTFKKLIYEGPLNLFGAYPARKFTHSSL